MRRVPVLPVWSCLYNEYVYTKKNFNAIHIMFHLILRACFLGNPWAYHTFWDESLNKQLKQVCRLCHQANFDAVAIIKGTEVLKRVASKRPIG
jgi:hypothetical protein